MEKFCPYEERGCCNFRECKKCDVRIKAKFAFKGNKMWNLVKVILEKFERLESNVTVYRREYENLNDTDMEILREFYHVLNDEEIFQEICKQNPLE